MLSDRDKANDWPHLMMIALAGALLAKTVREGRDATEDAEAVERYMKRWESQPWMQKAKR